tara:strand:+ start:6137 stop:6409 length:273 start_codon:yes stop_codon:yes gene_type:complete
MSSFFSMRDQMTTLCRKTKSDLFFDAPIWAILTAIELFPSGVVVAFLYGSATYNQDPTDGIADVNDLASHFYWIDQKGRTTAFSQPLTDW